MSRCASQKRWHCPQSFVFVQRFIRPLNIMRFFVAFTLCSRFHSSGHTAVEITSNFIVIVNILMTKILKLFPVPIPHFLYGIFHSTPSMVGRWWWCLIAIAAQINYGKLIYQFSPSRSEKANHLCSYRSVHAATHRQIIKVLHFFCGVGFISHSLHQLRCPPHRLFYTTNRILGDDAVLCVFRSICFSFRSSV